MQKYSRLLSSSQPHTALLESENTQPSPTGASLGLPQYTFRWIPSSSSTVSRKLRSNDKENSDQMTTIRQGTKENK